MSNDGRVTVRAAVLPDERDLVRTLFAAYAASLDVDLCFQGFDAELATLPGRYALPDGGIWLGSIDEVAVGCVALRALDDDHDRCEMKRLYLRPDARGAGLGRALAEAVVAGAKARGYRRLCLDTLPSMAGAIALYRSLGFVEIDAYCYNPVDGVLFLERRLD